MNQLIQSVVSTNALLSHFSTCFSNILLKKDFSTVVLVHTNKTIDLADDLYKGMASQTNFAWKVYNANHEYALVGHNSTKYFYERIFIIFVLDSFEFKEFDTNIYFMTMTRYKHWDDGLVFVRKKPSIYARNFFIRYNCFHVQTFNYAFIFFEDPIKFYLCSGYFQQILLVPFENLTCPSDIAERLYYDKTVNMAGTTLNVLTITNPPRVVRTVGRDENNEIGSSIDGLDVMVSDVIAENMNFTFKYFMMLNMSRLVGNKVTGENAKNAIYDYRYTGYMLIIKFRDGIDDQPFNVSKIKKYHIADNLTMDEIRPFISSYMFDIGVEAADYSNHLMSLKQTGAYYLYPHDTEVYIIIVPKILKSQLQLENLFKSPLISVWGLLIVVISLIRLSLARLTRSGVRVSDVIMDTFGLSLGISTEVKIGNISEKILVWFFCLSTMLSGMILSTYLFQGFALNVEVPTINSLDDLKQSKYQIQAPIFFYTVGQFFLEENIETTILAYEVEITAMVLNEDMRYAYVMRKSKFDTIVKNKKIWHIVQHFGEEFMSYKLWYCQGYVDRFNIVIQRIVEHGILAHLKEKNNLLLKSENHHVSKLITSNVSSVSLLEIRDTFLILLVGLLLAFAFILIEFLVVRVGRYRSTITFAH